MPEEERGQANCWSGQGPLVLLTVIARAAGSKKSHGAKARVLRYARNDNRKTLLSASTGLEYSPP